MARLRKERPPTASEQLEALLGHPLAVSRPTAEARLFDLDRHRRLARAYPGHGRRVDVFEAWFGDLFDELLGPCR